MKKVFSILLCAALLISLLASVSPVSAETGDGDASLGKLVQLQGKYTVVLGASKGIIVCAKLIDGQLRYGAVDYQGKVLVGFEHDSAIAPDKYGNFVMYRYENDGNMKSLVFNKNCTEIYSCDSEDYQVILSLSEGVAVIVASDGEYSETGTIKYINVNDKTELYSFQVDDSSELNYLTACIWDGYALACLGRNITVIDLDKKVSESKTVSGDGYLFVSSPVAGYAMVIDINIDMSGESGAEINAAYLLDIKTMQMTEIDTDLINRLMSYYFSQTNIVLNFGTKGVVYNEDGSKMGFADLLNFTEPSDYYDYINFSREGSKYWLVQDNDRCFYIDLEGNEYGDYLDATDFKSNIAAVIDDDYNTYIVDETFNQISQKRDIGSMVMAAGDNIFVSYGDDGYMTFYRFTTNPDERLLGDVDNDGVTTVSDVVALRGLIMKGADMSAMMEYIDIDGDTLINVTDVVTLRQRIIQG